MNIKLYLEQEKANLERAIAEDQKFLEKAPAGSLLVKPVGKNFAWVHRNYEGKNGKSFVNCENAENGASENGENCESKERNVKDVNRGDCEVMNDVGVNGRNGKKDRYLAKKDEELAKALVAKGYVTAKLKDEIENLKAANLYLAHCANSRTEKYLDKNDEYKRLLRPYLAQHDEDVEAWLEDKYDGPVTHPEDLTKMTRAGYLVRSKSEQMIVAHFIKYGIPHKYEQRLFVNGHDLYPDFMVMNPRTHKVYIWEHFGKMDDYNYRARNAGKVDDYASIGYLLGDNLIFTFETKKSGLDEIFVEKIIEHYLT